MIAAFGTRMHQCWPLSLVIILTGSVGGISADASDGYRLQRCMSYRNLTLEGIEPEWVPYQDAKDPCSLRCHDVTRGLKVVLENRMADGTRCRNRTADDLCLNGTCVSPGCDGRWGSGRVRDRCGLCGGDGSSCDSEEGRGFDSSSHFRWYHANYSACSVSCGVGFQTTEVKCRDERNQTTVGDVHCDVRMKPEVEMKPCRVRCKKRVWITGEWSACSVSCGGGGVKRRIVFCAEEIPDGSFERKEEEEEKEEDFRCTDRRPEATVDCQEVECPQWIAGQWSPCSTTSCSIGIQVRAVVCRSSSGADCPEAERPISERPCHSGLSCTDSSSSSRGRESLREHDFELGELRGRGDHGPSDLEPDGGRETSTRNRRHTTGRRQRTTVRPRRKNPDTRRPSERPRTVFVRPPPIRIRQEGSGDSDRPVKEVSEIAAELQSGPDEDGREVSTTPSFVASSWGQCSAVCGNGIRTRRVQCQVYEETNRSVVNLPDSSCSGPRPVDAEYCLLGDCIDEAVAENFSWSLSGYGLCSRSCAGGIQEALFSCLRISDFTMTKNEKCQHLPLPRKPPRSCNEIRCPPRWRAFPNGLCSSSCGGGQQLRNVRCVLDLDSGDFEEFADDRCPHPKPPRLALCNMAPCPPTWTVDSWSECSVTCGQGIQFRRVRCEQKVSLTTVATVNESLCASQSAPPQGNQSCQMKDCPVKAKQSIIRTDPKTFSQLNLRLSKVPLLVGGTAVFIPGTTVQITCSVRNFNRSLVTWHRGDRELRRKGRVRMTPKGLLRIRNSRPSDAGVYTCRAGSDSATINITFTTEMEARRLEQTKTASLGPARIERGNQGIIIDDEEEEQRHPISIKYLLRRFSPAELPLRFYPHPWSACSKTCGGSGLQSRDITCEVTMEMGYTLIVDDSYCHEKGLTKPIETRDCGYGSSTLTCPSWDAGPWNECTDESCFRRGVGSKTRSTYCVSHNGSRLASNYCSAESRPNEEEECEHENCTAQWTTSEWTTCSVSCGGRGVTTRTVDCTWEKSARPAAGECQQLPRPEASRPCFMPNCPEPNVCRDESKYCALIPKLHMCRFPQYKHECCHSCNLKASSGRPQVAPPTQALRSRHHSAV